ncbi:MAG: hypothetical protein ACE5HI_07480 [bacterium]
MVEEEKDDVMTDMCPLLELPCPRGEEAALQCCLRVQSNFDPLARFGDLCILECAKERAHRIRGATIKYFS